MTSHGEIKRVNGRRVASPEYMAWQNMRNRCLNPKCKDHWRYKNRKICPQWDRFENFLADMGRRPTPQHTLERIDNSKGYFKSNCTWATRQTQARNRPTYIKHSKKIADDVRALYATGKYTQKEVAAMFNQMTQVDVSQIVRNVRWK